jgi:hypothetical protein
VDINVTAEVCLLATLSLSFQQLGNAVCRARVRFTLLVRAGTWKQCGYCWTEELMQIKW